MEKSKILSEIESLKREHRVIHDHVVALSQSLQRSDLENFPFSRLRELIDFVQRHHEREESLFFPWLAQQAWVNQGGPRCTDFMGRRLMGMSISREWVKKHQMTLRKPDFLKSESSPLEIPLEEHQVGHAMAHEILQILDLDQKDPRLQRAIADWLELVEQHREKEDECLLAMVLQALK